MSMSNPSDIIIFNMVTSGVPEELIALPSEVDTLLQKEFKGVNFDREKEIASELTAIKLMRAKTFEPPSPIASMLVEPSKTENQPTIGLSVASNSDSFQNYPTDFSAYDKDTFHNKPSATSSDYSRTSLNQNQMVERMIKETNQTQEYCMGYLEMMGWDYDSALKLYKDML